MFAVFRELDGDMGPTFFTVLSFKKPHHDGCVKMGCDADGAVSENL